MGSVPLLRSSQEVRETTGQTGGRLVKCCIHLCIRSKLYKNKELGLKMVDVLQVSQLLHLELCDFSHFFFFFGKKKTFFPQLWLLLELKSAGCEGNRC